VLSIMRRLCPEVRLPNVLEILPATADREGENLQGGPGSSPRPDVGGRSGRGW